MKLNDFIKVNTIYGIVREERMQGDFKIERPDGSFIYAFPEQCEVITENEYLRGAGKRSPGDVIAEYINKHSAFKLKSLQACMTTREVADLLEEELKKEEYSKLKKEFPKPHITVVTGPVASGKTHYVNEHAKADRYTLIIDSFMDISGYAIEQAKGKDLIIEGTVRSSVKTVVNMLNAISIAFGNVFITTQNNVTGYELWHGLKDTHVVKLVNLGGTTRSQSFTDAAKPLMQWLAENEHPHVKAIVRADGAELLEEKLGIVNNR
jgi:hypothetical protein